MKSGIHEESFRKALGLAGICLEEDSFETIFPVFLL
jgi:hypothetical protein